MKYTVEDLLALSATPAPVTPPGERCYWCGSEELHLLGVLPRAGVEPHALCRACLHKTCWKCGDSLNFCACGSPCAVCGLPLRVGEQPCVVRPIPHAPVGGYHPFIPYFDVGLGREVTSLADRWNGMRHPETDRPVVDRHGNIAEADQPKRLEYRDKVSPGELSARKDRMMERRRQQGIPT